MVHRPQSAEPDEPTRVSPERRSPPGRPAAPDETTTPPAQPRAPDLGASGPGMAVAVPRAGEETLSSQGLYSVGKEIGRGGMGRVSVAWDHNLQRHVAVKELLPGYQRDEEAGERFLREAFLTGGLEHPGMVPVHHFGTTAEGLPFYTMRFISGQTLQDAIRDLAHLPPDEAAFRRFALMQRVLQACHAVGYAHAHGVIHRDIKPSNIMLGEHGETVVLDWGVAKKLDEADPGSDAAPRAAEPGAGFQADPDGVRSPTPMGGTSTRAGAIVGTPAYMAPEQARGDVAQVGPGADVFSLGATLYCLVTGHAPYAAHPTERMLEAAARAEFPSPRQLAPQTPPALETIILRAMAPNPSDRYARACEFAEDLERCLTGQLVKAHRYTTFERLQNWYRRHRIPILTMLLLGIATNAVAFGLAGMSLVRSLSATLLWTADTEVQKSMLLIQEWLAPAAGALGLAEDVAHRVGADRAAGQEALRTLTESIPNVVLLYYSLADGAGGSPVNIGSDATRPFPLHLDARERPWYESAVAAGGKLAISEPYPDVQTGMPCVSISRWIPAPAAPAQPDLVVSADINLTPLVEFMRPRNFPEGGAVLVTAVDRTRPYPERWAGAKPVLGVSTLDAAVFDGTGSGTSADVAERLLAAVSAWTHEDGGLDLDSLLAGQRQGRQVQLAVESAAYAEIGGKGHAVFTAPVTGIPWDVSVIIPVQTLSRPFVAAGGILLRTSGGGLILALGGLGLYYGLRRRRNPAGGAPFESRSLPSGSSR